MKKSILLLVVLAVIAGTAGYGVRTAFNSTLKKPSPAFTVVWQVTDYFPDGTSIPRYIETRYVSGNGKWHSVKNGADVNEESFGEPNKGVFRKQKDKLYFVSELPVLPPLTEEDLVNSRNYLRTETLLGYKAIVVSSGNRPRTGSEFYVVPALGGEIIKEVIADNKTGLKTVHDPISLTLGEPDASVVALPNGLPIDYETIKAMRQKGSGKPQ
ncbi:MAG: hypothetical protein AABN95_22045 [Acidobacteriota bacterium]